MSRRPATRPDLEQLPPPVRAYIVWLEAQLDGVRRRAAANLRRLREEELKGEAYQRALDAAGAPALPFTPEPSAYTRRRPHCDKHFDRRGFGAHERVCARDHGAAPTTVIKKHRSTR